VWGLLELSKILRVNALGEIREIICVARFCCFSDISVILIPGLTSLSSWQVQAIPPGGELLGYSERTGIELFAVGDHVLGIQGHPEFTEDVVRDLIDTRHSAGILKVSFVYITYLILRPVSLVSNFNMDYTYF
jgi:hypothetical protein